MEEGWEGALGRGEFELDAVGFAEGLGFVDGAGFGDGHLHELETEFLGR